MAHNDTRLANESWEALFRAQMTVLRELHTADAWDELLPNEYGVLYELSKSPEGLRMTDLLDDVLLSQAGVSRLVTRLESAGMIARAEDDKDRRATRLRLTVRGSETQRRIGRQHARHVTAQMSSRLNGEQLVQLRDLCRAMLASEPIGGVNAA
ncbi:MarR family transcriptional regulator [Microbacterium sp. LWS13-1.2]|uniref:MarR family transcriptional regulator n=1 Tax=Microbacterium sp. LWS13-1.2 TaxID=3135264 RepID=A0AAU6S8P8_9MICO